MIDFDKEVSAGIYVYAVEELGSSEVLKNVQNGKLPDFRHHNKKFKKAKEYLDTKKHPECFYLNEGAFDSDAFDTDGFDTEVVANTNARLGNILR